MDKIKEFKILNCRKNSSSNSITLQLSINDNIEIEPKSFNSLNKFEELNLNKENMNNKQKDKLYEYEPVITASEFIPFRDNLCKINFGSNNTSKTIFNYDRQNQNNNYFHFQNNNEITTKYALDNYYRENSEKNYNDGLLNKDHSLNSY